MKRGTKLSARASRLLLSDLIAFFRRNSWALTNRDRVTLNDLEHAAARRHHARTETRHEQHQQS